MKSRLALSVLSTAIVLLAATFSCQAAIVTFEAESGSLGTNFLVGNSGGATYISNTNNNSASIPGIAGRVVSYTVAFPEAGTYDLYARVLIGPAGASDDSFLYGNGFGAKSPTNGTDWILCNNLWNVGYTNTTDIVAGGGTAQIGTWKWIDVSQFNGGQAPINFTVAAGGLTQTFQIGGREDGLSIDKFAFGTTGTLFSVSNLDTGTESSPAVIALPPDIVAGNLIQFNDNGNWTWYSDERSIVDKIGGKIIVGSDGNGAGLGGSGRNGAIEAAIFDLRNRTSQRYTMLANGILGPDDHNAPAFLLRPDGKYLSQWTGHNQNYLSYFSVFDGTNWNPFTTFDWQALGAATTDMASYSNPHYLSAENRTYTLVRSLDIKSMNILVSTNYGDTWTYYGKLNRSYPGSGYNPGYYKFCDNGKDRIDFICTESHPRDTLTSIYHGYISNNMSFKTDGTVVDNNLNDTNAPLSSDFQLVFSNGTVMPPGMTNYRCWDDDVQRYNDGTIECIISARINQFAHIGGYPDQEDPDHAFFFCRYDGTNWTPTYLCQAGYKLYSAEADYVGLGCLSPNDPNTIFISTKYDPRAVQPGVFDTNQPYSNFHEIWKGVTTNHGASFTWTPVTQNSTHDNLRPVIPAWDSNNIVLIWFRATYSTAQIIDGAPVGIVERHSEAPATMTYVDADVTNTALVAGQPLVIGDGIGQWHLRTGVGNNGGVLASADIVAEDAPTLETTVSVPAAGMYDLWVNFWGNPLSGSDWRIMAGLMTNRMQVYRQMACETVQAGDHNSSLVVTDASTNFLYQAYVGRVSASGSNTVSVFVDDNALAVGTVSTLGGNTNRTWYDGVSYAPVSPFQIQTAFHTGPKSIAVVWNSIVPASSLTTPTYTLQKKNSLNDANWTTVATGILSGGSSTTNVDTAATNAAAFYRVTWP